jgi:hypothetical protein
MPKCSDVSTEMLLSYLAERQGSWTMAWELPWPDGTPQKVKLAKMRNLNDKGLVGGCPCGCRGDFEITDKGLERIGKTRSKPYTGY